MKYHSCKQSENLGGSFLFNLLTTLLSQSTTLKFTVTEARSYYIRVVTRLQNIVDLSDNEPIQYDVLEENLSEMLENLTFLAENVSTIRGLLITIQAFLNQLRLGLIQVSKCDCFDVKNLLNLIDQVQKYIKQLFALYDQVSNIIEVIQNLTLQLNSAFNLQQPFTEVLAKILNLQVQSNKLVGQLDVLYGEFYAKLNELLLTLWKSVV